MPLLSQSNICEDGWSLPEQTSLLTNIRLRLKMLSGNKDYSLFRQSETEGGKKFYYLSRHFIMPTRLNFQEQNLLTQVYFSYVSLLFLTHVYFSYASLLFLRKFTFLTQVYFSYASLLFLRTFTFSYASLLCLNFQKASRHSFLLLACLLAGWSKRKHFQKFLRKFSFFLW